MGRARKDGDPLGLAGTRLSFKHGAFYYRHRDGRWEHVGTDVKVAKERATLYNDPEVIFGGIKVGGIRISHMSDIAEAKSMALTTKKSQRAQYTVKPLPRQQAEKKAAPKEKLTITTRSGNTTAVSPEKWQSSLLDVIKNRPFDFAKDVMEANEANIEAARATHPDHVAAVEKAWEDRKAKAETAAE